MFVNVKEIFKFKADNKNVNCPTQFCLGSISNGFGNTEPRKVSLNGNVYDSSVDHNSIDKSDTLNNQKYLMNKDSIKQFLIKCNTKCLALLNKYLLYY